MASSEFENEPSDKAPSTSRRQAVNDVWLLKETKHSHAPDETSPVILGLTKVVKIALEG